VKLLDHRHTEEQLQYFMQFWNSIPYLNKMNKRTAIITGAGHGIGETIAKQFAHNGYRVVIAEINELNGQRVADEINGSGGNALFLKTDVANLAGIQTMITRTIEHYGAIDVLINNAGLSEFCDPLEITEEQWDRVLDTNLNGMFFASREAVKQMKDSGGGSIVNIASTRAMMSEPNSEAYASSKGGILGLTHAMAASFSRYHITVNAILPGWIETGDYSALRDIDHQQHFSGRVGKPDDIARACLFLSSPENNFITGTQLVIDGGMTRKMIYEE
jgi:NAD(P)-dependent dehydrogenase (short-subunit alcohol dehydrogenase family)